MNEPSWEEMVRQCPEMIEDDEAEIEAFTQALIDNGMNEALELDTGKDIETGPTAH